MAAEEGDAAHILSVADHVMVPGAQGLGTGGRVRRRRGDGEHGPGAGRRPGAYLSAASVIVRATGAARPLPLTSERSAPESSITTATATCLPVSGDSA